MSSPAASLPVDITITHDPTRSWLAPNKITVGKDRHEVVFFNSSDTPCQINFVETKTFDKSSIIIDSMATVHVPIATRLTTIFSVGAVTADGDPQPVHVLKPMFDTQHTIEMN